MPGPYLLLADTILFSVKIQQLHFFIAASQLIAWGIALVVGFLTWRLIGRRMAFGIIGTFLAALVGIWLATSVIIIGIPHDFSVYDIPLLKAFIGAIILEVAWYFLTYNSYRVWANRRKYRKDEPKISIK